MKVVYLDNNATTRTAPEVVEAMLPYFTDLYGNPSSMHSFGGQLAKPVQQAREQVAGLIKADPAEIVFTSCGTESDNGAIWGTLNSYPQKKPYRYHSGGTPGGRKSGYLSFQKRL
jgi:cysteine desulfurase